MEKWCVWNDFLKIKATDHKLTPAQTEVFLDRFARENLEKKDEDIASDVLGSTESSIETYKKRRTKVYKKFARSCVDIDHPNQGKYPVLRDWLEKEYADWLDSKNSGTTEEFKSIHPEANPSPFSNPFIPLTGIVDDPKLFFGREREIGQIFELLNSRSSVALIGERAIGKSSVLKAIERKAGTDSDLSRKPVYLSLQKVEKEEDFYSYLCDELEIPECRGYQWTRALKKHCLLLLIDEVEKMAGEGFTHNLRDILRSLAEGSDAPLRLIMAAREPLDTLFEEGRTSPLANICTEVKLDEWDESTARAFIKNRLDWTNVRFTEAEISKLITESGGHPQKLMQRCHETYSGYLENQQ